MEDGIDKFIDPEASRIAWIKSLERRDRKNYFLSGFETQDKAIGAFERGALNSVGGFTGKGKTAFLISMSYQMIRKHGTRVYYCNFEMSSSSMWNRLACIHDPSLNLMELRQAEMTPERARYFIQLSMDLVNFVPLFCENTDIRTLIKTATAEIKRDSDSVLIVDYFALLSMRGFSSTERFSFQAECAKLLKHLASNLNIPLIVAIQLNPSSEDRQGKIPILADFRGDKEIIHHSNVVLALARERRDQLDVYCLKNRNGPSAMFSLEFIENRAAVQEFEK